MNKLNKIRKSHVKKYMKDNADDAFESGYIDGWNAAIALGLHIEFMNWTLSGDSMRFDCTDENQWWDEDEKKNLTTQEMFDYWIENIYK